MVTNSTNKILSIINGKSFKEKKFSKLFDYFNQNNIDFIISTHKNHIAEIIQESGRYEGFIVIGGDGTIHEAVNSNNHTNQWIVFLPGGTVNCIANFFKMKLSVSFIHKLLQANRTVSFDLLKARFYTSENVYSKYILGFITIGHLTNMTVLSEKLKWMPKFMRYPSAAFLNFFSLQKFNINYNSDSEKKSYKTCTSIIINNCSAEFFSTLRKSEYNDGKFEYLIENHSIFSQILSIYSRFIHVFGKSKWETNNNKLNIEFDKPLPIMADGEIFQNIIKLELQIIPSIQRVKLPL